MQHKESKPELHWHQSKCRSVR